MVPSTMNISAMMGSSASRPTSRTRHAGAASRGATEGQILAATAMISMKMPASMKPGMKPAR